MLLQFARSPRKAPVARPAKTPQSARRALKLGLALGGGAARGWAHIGVLWELLDSGFAPDIVAGTSVGAAVGGAFVAGKLAEMEAFARSLTRRRVLGLIDLSFQGRGLIGGHRLRRRLFGQLAQSAIEDLPVTFGAVATELGTGHEVWLTKGPLCDAIRASYALPGIFEPVEINGRWLIDGAMVNPVPVTLCRALGADVVIAVNLSEPLVRGTVVQDGGGPAAMATPVPPPGDRGLRQMLRGFGARAEISRPFEPTRNPSPGIGSVLVDAFNITQDRITRSRLAGDPPDVSVVPKYGKIHLFDFHRADELIAVGREAVRRVLPELLELAPQRSTA